MTRVLITDPFYANINGAGPWYAAQALHSKYWAVEIPDVGRPLLLLDNEVRVIRNHIGNYNPWHWAEVDNGKQAHVYDTKPGYGRHKEGR